MLGKIIIIFCVWLYQKVTKRRQTDWPFKFGKCSDCNAYKILLQVKSDHFFSQEALVVDADTADLLEEIDSITSITLRETSGWNIRREKERSEDSGLVSLTESLSMSLAE